MLNTGISITKNIEKYNSLINYMFSNNKFLKNKINPIFLPTENDIKNKIKNLDVLLTYNINKNYFNDKNNNLKWIHIGNAGVDNSLFKESDRYKTMKYVPYAVNEKQQFELKTGVKDFNGYNAPVFEVTKF